MSARDVPADGRPAAAATRRFLAPELDGELVAASAPVEEFLLELACWAEDEPRSPVPASLGRAAANAAGELRVALLRADYQALYGPDGVYEHEPLAIVVVPEGVVTTFAAAVRELAAAAPTGSELGDALTDFAAQWPQRPLVGQRGTAAWLVDVAARLQGVCDLSWGPDERLVAARLEQATTPAEAGAVDRVVLTDAEEAAYRRIRDRLVAIWHDHDPLARWQY